jgi:hypothetical protein
LASWEALVPRKQAGIERMVLEIFHFVKIVIRKKFKFLNWVNTCLNLAIKYNVSKSFESLKKINSVQPIYL